MPNAVAYLVLALWPFVLLYLFKKMDAQKAVIWGVVSSYLLLPLGAEFDLKVIPELGKETLPHLIILAFCMLKQKDFKLVVEDTFARRLIIIFLISPIFTVMSNSDGLVYGNVVLPALTIKDALKPTFNNIFMYIVPLVLGRHYLRTSESHKYLLQAIVVACIFYTIPILWEIRMSPQLHAKIYGFFPHAEFSQQIRFGGFRPVVFLGHGLLVAFFISIGVAAATCLYKCKDDVMVKYGKIKLIGSIAILVLCKSVGAILYGLVMFLLITFSTKKMILRISAIFAIIVLTFPIMRAEGIFPAKQLTDFAARYDADRAQSLQFRFDNEDRLLEKAGLRPILGWGGWGRNLIYNKWTDKSDVVTDGTWIIILGMWGYVGFLAFFGLLCYIPIRIYRSASNRKSELSWYTVCLTLILGFNLVELLPNSSLSAVTMLIAGALLGSIEQKSKPQPRLSDANDKESKSDQGRSIA